MIQRRNLQRLGGDRVQQVTLSADVLARIGHDTSEVQVVDETGNVKGYLVSAEFRSLVYSWVKTLFSDDDELRLARAETGGFTTSEAVAYLRDRAATARGGS